MKNNSSSLFKMVFCFVVCVLFFLASAAPALSAPKKDKKDKTDTVTETPTAPAESPTSGVIDVYAEGAYTTGDLTVYIYADIYVDGLVSFGVDLGYDNTKLGSPDAYKNEAVWYFGTTGDKKPYMNPEYTTGHVIFIGGKLDEGDATAGVTGTRVLLGKVTFTRTDTGDPGETPETYFDISLALGRPAPYDNFVTTDGTDATLMDSSVAFGSRTIFERGDATADRIINVNDLSAIQYYMTNGGIPHPWLDCTGDDLVNVQDLSCIQYYMTH